MTGDFPLTDAEVARLSDDAIIKRFERLVSDSREWQVHPDAINQLRDEIKRRMR